MIDKLYDGNARLSEEVCQLRRRKDIEFGRRHFAEEEICRLQSNQQRLEEQVRNSTEEAAYFRGIVERCFCGLDKVLPVLEELKKDTSY